MTAVAAAAALTSVAMAGTASAEPRATSSTPAPIATAGAVDVAAPLSGTRIVAIPVSLSEPAATRATLRYHLIGGTALSGRDFRAASGIVTFNPHASSAAIPVTVVADGTRPTSACWYQGAAACRTFSVTLAVASGSIKVATAPSTDAILWNPPDGQGVSVGDAVVVDGSTGGSRIVSVPVTLAEPASHAISVAYKLAAGSALAKVSFAAAQGTIRFAAGSTTSHVDVSIVPGKGFQPYEVLYVKLSHPSGATIARVYGTVVIATGAAGVAHPISAGFTAATLTQIVSAKTRSADSYTVTAGGSTAAMSANAPVLSSNDRMAYWPSAEALSKDQESCATWSSQAPAQANGVFTQEGLALRMATIDGVTRGLTVTKNVYGNADWVFNVHLWDTAWTTPFRLVMGFNLSSYLVTGGTTAQLPWDVCARVVGSTFQFEVWLDGQTPPAWGDATQGGTVTVPAGWDYAGDAGWYIGHLAAGASASYDNMIDEAPQAAPAI